MRKGRNSCHKINLARSKYETKMITLQMLSEFWEILGKRRQSKMENNQDAHMD
jgi:hypothetical protein